jgi:hypothetical protein
MNEISRAAREHCGIDGAGGRTGQDFERTRRVGWQQVSHRFQNTDLIRAPGSGTRQN